MHIPPLSLCGTPLLCIITRWYSSTDVFIVSRKQIRGHPDAGRRSRIFESAFHRLSGRTVPHFLGGETVGRKIELENEVEIHLSLFYYFYYVECRIVLGCRSGVGLTTNKELHPK